MVTRVKDGETEYLLGMTWVTDREKATVFKSALRASCSLVYLVPYMSAKVRETVKIESV